MPRPLAVVHARLLACDGRGTEAEALLTDGSDRLALVGSRARVEAEARRVGAEVVDAGDGAVVPGFVDAHTHLAHWGQLEERVDLHDTRTAAEAVERIRRRAAADRRTGRDGWLLAERWDESRWTEKRYPTRAELDDAERTRPVLMRRVCGHIAVTNTAGLERLPASARYVDRAAGLLTEDVVLTFSQRFPPPPGETERALRRAQADALRLGVTSAQDMVNAAMLRAWQALRAAGRLALRVRLNPYHDLLPSLAAAGLRTGFGDAWLRLGALKLFTDGSVGAHTAAMEEPYRDEPDQRGLLLWRDADLALLARDADAAGFQLAMHAIGDRAIDQCLRVAALLPGARRARGSATNGRRTAAPRLGPLRHRVEHYEFATEDQIRRTAALGLAASSQPNFVGEWSAKGGLYERRLGARYRENNRFARMADEGVATGFGSDCMPFGPLAGIAAAANAPHAAQRLPVEQAVERYTRGAATLAFEEREKGTLARGRLADFVVLTDDLADRRRVGAAAVALTVVGGSVAFSARRRRRAAAVPP